MTLKGAIDIGKTMNCFTIGDVDYLISSLHFKYDTIDEQSFEEYCNDFDIWCELYEQEFPNAFFVDCEI